MVKTPNAVLVTGGAGYIGAHCCKALSEAGLLPIVYDDLSTGHRDFVKWGPLIQGDIRDGHALESAFEVHRPIAVLHCAALSLVAESWDDPGLYWDVNVGGTLTLLESMLEMQLQFLVYSSSCAVYGEAGGLPISEDHRKAPVNPYGATKWAAEQMMEQFSSAHNLRSLRLRYFNAAGADESAEIGEDHHPETHLIPLVLDAAMGARQSVTVFGDHYPTPDGTAIRDYVHVTDLADAHLAALKYLLSGGKTDAVNLGTGSGTSVEEVIQSVERVLGKTVAKTLADPRAGDPAQLVADPAAAQALLQWKARRSDIDSIVTDAWRWQQKRSAEKVVQLMPRGRKN